MKIVVIYNGKRKNDEVLTVKSVKEFCNEPFYFWDILQKKQRLLAKKQLLFWMIGCKQRAAGERKVFCLWLVLEKSFESGSARLGHILVQFHLLRKCGLLAHTSAAFLKNCCTEKLFVCLRLVLQNTPCNHKIRKERFSSIFYQK